MTDITKNNPATTNVNLNTIFSTPLLVNEEEFELLEKPVPLTWSKTKIINNKAEVDWIICTTSFIDQVYRKFNKLANLYVI